jgi:thiol-disulfide isomerase/thioredoxin
VLAETAATRLREAGNQPAPLFALQDLQKQLHSLDGFAGRVVVVHFFATWCEPCRDELASLNSLAAQLPDAAVLAVDVAEPASRVAKFLSGNPVGFRVVLDTDRAVTKAWAVATLPTTIVLGPDLQPRLIAEGQMDWGNPDVVAQLRTLTNSTHKQASREKKE